MSLRAKCASGDRSPSRMEAAMGVSGVALPVPLREEERQVIHTICSPY
jgi:hypothetical protein